MKKLKPFRTAMTWCLGIVILLIVAVLLMVLDGCTTTHPEQVERWVRWTSPNPRVGSLDRVVILRHSMPITEDNFNQTLVMTINNSPAAPGESDSACIAFDDGNEFYIAAISFNTIYPATRSKISNTVFVGGPTAITDLRF